MYQNLHDTSPFLLLKLHKIYRQFALNRWIAYNELSIDLMKIKLNKLYWSLRKTLEEGETILDISNIGYDAERKGKEKAEKDYNNKN